jgi:hypothetical protein
MGGTQFTSGRSVLSDKFDLNALSNAQMFQKDLEFDFTRVLIGEQTC